jgi:hypothetical protein
VHDATTGELRRADRALTGATGALLLVRLLAAAGDLAARLGLGRALRAAASWATTTWCISGMFACTSKISSGSSTEPALRPRR